jgi:hypothetical protein
LSKKPQLDKVREVVYLRCKGFCEKCGKRLPESWALHHRKLRSRGGADTPSNFVALRHGCHNLDTNSVHFNPAESVTKGLMVSSWASPEECPLTLPDGSIVTLTEEGEYLFIERKNDGW